MLEDFFSKAEETDLSKIEDDEEVERLAEGLMNL